MVPRPGPGHTSFSLYHSDIANLALDIYCEFVNQASLALERALGMEKAKAALKKEWEHVGQAVPLNVIERMKLKDKGFVVAGFCNLWADQLMDMDQASEVTAVGIRAKVRSCPLSSGSHAFCYSHLDVSVARLCELFAPGHHAVSRRYLSKGDGHCEILLLADSSTPDEILRASAIASILPPPIEEEERILWSHSYLSHSWYMSIKAMNENLGPESTVDVLTPIFLQAGVDFAPRVERVFGIRTGELESVAKGIDKLNSALLLKGKLVKTSSIEFEMQTTDCPLVGEVKEACALYEAFCQGVVRGLNPAFEYSCVQSMSEGAESCRWLLRDKREIKAKPAGEDSANDPFSLLSIRYVRGEISDEEYEKKMAMLKKHHPR